MSKNGLYLSEETNKGGYGNPNGLYLSEKSSSSNEAVRIGGSLYSKNWDSNYNGLSVPNGHGSLFRAMDEDARIIAKCEANKLLWIAESNKQKALATGANLNAPIIPPPVLNNPVPNNPPMSELERALARIKELEEANAVKDLEIARLNENTVSKEEVEKIVNDNKEAVKAIEEREKIKNSMISEQLHTISDLREDKKEIKLEKNEWKAKCEAKDESLHKLTEELANEKMKVIELSKKNILLSIHDSDDSNFSVLEKIDNEHNVPIVGQNEIIEQL